MYAGRNHPYSPGLVYKLSLLHPNDQHISLFFHHLPRTTVKGFIFVDMSINLIIVTVFTILSHLVYNDHRSVRDVLFLLEEVVIDTSYFISYTLPIPPIPFTIDPSPPVLAPPFDPANPPTAAHTNLGATSADPCVVSRSVDMVVCLVVVMVSGILLSVSLIYFA